MSFIFSQPLSYKKNDASFLGEGSSDSSISGTPWNQEIQSLFLEAITFWLEDSVLETKITYLEPQTEIFSGLLIEVLNETRILLHAIEELMPDSIEINKSLISMADYHIFLNFDDDFSEATCLGYSKKEFLLQVSSDQEASDSTEIQMEQINPDMDFLWVYLANEQKRNRQDAFNNIVMTWRKHVEGSGWKVERMIKGERNMITMGDSPLSLSDDVISEFVQLFRDVSIEDETIRITLQSKSNVENGEPSVSFRILLEPVGDSHFIPIGTNLSIFTLDDRPRLLGELNCDETTIQLLESQTLSVSNLEDLRLILKVVDREYLNIELLQPFPKIEI
jgi:hypothetical protein